MKTTERAPLNLQGHWIICNIEAYAIINVDESFNIFRLKQMADILQTTLWNESLLR